MLARPCLFGRLLFCSVVCLLLCGIVSAELPELLSLTDNTSNDFTTRKAGSQECKSILSATIHKSIPLDSFECGADTHCAVIFLATETTFSDLLAPHSVLRR